MEPTTTQTDTSVSQIPEQKFPPLPPPQDVPGCLVYDQETDQYRTINPLTQRFKPIKDEFIDMSFIQTYTATPLTSDGGVIKYTDPNIQSKSQENPVEDPNATTNLPPEPLARVRILFEGRKEDGELLDKQRERKQTRAFKLHNDNMISGLHIATASLRAGEWAWFKFMPQYHFGVQGSPPHVPENAVLYYKVELVDFTNQKKQLANDDYDGRVQALEEAREKGNEAFKKQEYDRALKEYKKGLGLMGNLPKVLQAVLTEDQKNVFKDFQVKLANNVLMVCIKKKTYSEGLQNAEIVLKNDPKNAKGLFRKGQCLKGLQYWDAAIKVFEECMEVDKESQEECRRMIEECRRMKGEKNKSEQRRFKQVFEKMSEQEEKDEAERRLKGKIERRNAKKQMEEAQSNVKQDKDKNQIEIQSLLEGTLIDTAGEQRVKVDLGSVSCK